MELDFLHSAEQDYYALQTLTNPRVYWSNTISYVAEQACEKYLKHLICQEMGIGKEYDYKAPIRKSDLHNLPKLCKLLQTKFNYEMPFDMKTEFRNLFRLYNDTRYPDQPFYHDITNKDVKLCIDVAEKCRTLTLARIKEIEMEKDKEIDYMDYLR